MSKASDTGKSFFAGVVEKLPEVARAAVLAAFEDPGAVSALEVLGTGALGQSEINRRFDEITKKEDELTARFQELNGWYEVNEPVLKAHATLKAELETLKAERKPTAGDPPPPAPLVDARKVAEEVVNESGREYVQVSAWLAGKVAQHQQMFGEALDAMAIVQNPKLGKPVVGQPGRVFNLDDAYREAHGERVVTKQKEVEDKRFEAEVDRRFAERMKAGTTHPFPLRGETSVLDVLGSKEGAAVHTVDSAAALYESLQQKRAAGV